MYNWNDNNDTAQWSAQNGQEPVSSAVPEKPSVPVRPEPLHIPARSPSTPALLVLSLVLATVFGTGLFAGWEFGSRNMVISPLGDSAATTPVADSTREAVIAKVRPTVVQINVNGLGGTGLGSGIIIDRRGYILTNEHVIEGGFNIDVMLANGQILPAQLVGGTSADDLAVVKVDPSKAHLPVATLGDSSKLRVGQEVIAIGNPLGITQTVTNGIISALGRNVATGMSNAILSNTIQTNAAINPGNSGGALADMQGNIIGIPTLTAIDPKFRAPASGLGFAIPVNRVKFIAPQLIKSGKVTHTGRAALGIRAVDIDAAMATERKLPVEYGVLVIDVTPGGAAARAGIHPKDIIINIDKKMVIGVLSLNDVLMTKAPGDTVAVQVYRGGQQLTMNVKLSEMPTAG